MTRRDAEAKLTDAVIVEAIQARDVATDEFHAAMKGHSYGRKETAAYHAAGLAGVRNVLLDALGPWDEEPTHCEHLFINVDDDGPAVCDWCGAKEVKRGGSR